MANSTTILANQAITGFKDASSYDQHRPTYRSEALETLLKHMNIHLDTSNKLQIVELAAGTGKFTLPLIAKVSGRTSGEYEHGKDPNLGQVEILVTEPHEEMRRELEKNLEGLSLGDESGVKVNVTNGVAANIPVADRWADGIIAAQAFHWFATQESLIEIRRVLKPGNFLGMIWNLEDYNSPLSWTPTTVWESKIKDIVWEQDDNQPRFRHFVWQNVFQEANMDALFRTPLQEQLIPFTVYLSPDALWKRLRTISQIAVMEGELLDTSKKRFDNALKGDDVEWNEKGEVAVHGSTYLAWVQAI